MAQTQDHNPVGVVQMKLSGTIPAVKISALRELASKVNYFIGNKPQDWSTSIPTYATVLYQEVYPGIDLIYHGNQGQLEYDFVVQPGANPKTIKYDLVTQPRTNHENQTAEGSKADSTASRPYCFQR